MISRSEIVAQQADSENLLQKTFDDTRMQSFKAGTFGEFCVRWTVKDGRAIAVETTATQKRMFPKPDAHTN